MDRWEPADAHDIALTADVVLFRGGGGAPGTAGGRLPDDPDVPEESRSRESTVLEGWAHCSGPTCSSSINTAKDASLREVNSLLSPSSGRLFDLVSPSELPKLIMDVVISLSWLILSEPAAPGFLAAEAPCSMPERPLNPEMVDTVEPEDLTVGVKTRPKAT